MHTQNPPTKSTFANCIMLPNTNIIDEWAIPISSGDVNGYSESDSALLGSPLSSSSSPGFRVRLDSIDTASDTGFALPKWMFDVEEHDENLELLSSGKTMLQELEIDPQKLLQIIVWQFKCPFFALLRRFNNLSFSFDNSRYAALRLTHYICGRVVDYNSHPIRLVSRYSVAGGGELSTYTGYGEEPYGSSASNAVEGEVHHIDFWGPWLICTGFAALLWLGDQKNVPYVYVIWFLGALVTHLTVRPFLEGSSLLFHLAILGYSLCPQIPLCLAILVFNPSITVSTVLQFFSVAWSCLAALMSYSMILRPLIAKPDDRIKLMLLYPIVTLFQIYMVTLVPLRHRQVNAQQQPVTFA